MGNYHPHGDAAIYDTLVRLAQPFSLRYPLVDGQGNFGNIDGVSRRRHALHRGAARADGDRDAARHRRGHGRLRAELRRVAATSPQVLPSRFPNLLVNGSSGIAVGMATNMPPHNLGEVVDALVAMIDDPTIDVERPDAAHQGPRLPDRRHHPRPRRDQGGVPLRPRPHRRARARPHRGAARRQDGDRRHRAPVRRQEGRRRRRDHEDRRARQGRA